MYLLAKRLLRTGKIPKCMSTDCARQNKNSEQSANNQVRTDLFGCQTFCLLSLKEILDFFFFLFLHKDFLFFGAVFIYASSFVQCV